MKKEYTLIFIVGLFLLAYLLDSVVNPLDLDLPTPYHYFQSEYVTLYPFTTASIIIKALGLFLAPLWLFSFWERQYSLKATFLLVLASLMQLYALQDIVSGDKIVPIEWSLSISMAGACLLVPCILFFIRGFFSSMHEKLVEASGQKTEYEEDKESILVPKER